MNQYPLIKGKTDLKTRFPEVAAQWDDEKNEGTGGQPGTGARTARATRWTAV